MILFNDRTLAQQLHSEVVTERQQLTYLAIIMGILALSPMVATTAAPNVIFGVVGVLENVGIVFYAYRVNSRGDGHHFISRFICLAIPIAVKLMVVWVLLNLPLALFHILAHSTQLWDHSAQLIFWCNLMILTALWLRRITIDFRIASGQSG